MIEQLNNLSHTILNSITLIINTTCMGAFATSRICNPVQPRGLVWVNGDSEKNEDLMINVRGRCHQNSIEDLVLLQRTVAEHKGTLV